MRPQFFPEDHLYIDASGKEYEATTRICSKTPRGINFDLIPNQEKVRLASYRGTVRHKELQELIIYWQNEEDLDDFTCAFDSTQWFKDNLLSNKRYDQWLSELIVWSDEPTTSYAGSIDLVCHDNETEHLILWDLKTGGHSTVDYQLSLYKRAYCKNYGVDPNNVELRCIDAKNEDNINVLNVRTIPGEWLDKLLYCYAHDEKYHEPTFIELANFPRSLQDRLDSYEVAITQLEEELKLYKEKEDLLRKELYKAMDEAGIEKFQFGSVSATRVVPTETTTIDSKTLKQEMPEIYQKYSKTSKRSGYVLIKVKDVTTNTEAEE